MCLYAIFLFFATLSCKWERERERDWLTSFTSHQRKERTSEEEENGEEWNVWRERERERASEKKEKRDDDENGLWLVMTVIKRFIFIKDIASERVNEKVQTVCVALELQWVREMSWRFLEEIEVRILGGESKNGQKQSKGYYKEGGGRARQARTRKSKKFTLKWNLKLGKSKNKAGRKLRLGFWIGESKNGQKARQDRANHVKAEQGLSFLS
jgi:hypothetical protein